jgi:hypothetical protein
MMTTNSAHAVQAGVGDRRFYVLDVDDEMAQQRSWFDPMRKDLDEGVTGSFCGCCSTCSSKTFTRATARRPLSSSISSTGAPTA